MRCKNYSKWTSLYIDNELKGKDLVDFKTHLSQCTVCQKEVEILKEIMKQINELEKVEVPDGFHKELMGKIGLQVKKDKSIQLQKNDKKWYLNWKIGSAIAAAFIFSVLIFEVLNINSPKQVTPESVNNQIYSETKFPEAASTRDIELETNFPEAASTRDIELETNFPEAASTRDIELETNFPEVASTRDIELETNFPEVASTRDIELETNFPEVAIGITKEGVQIDTLILESQEKATWEIVTKEYKNRKEILNKLTDKIECEKTVIENTLSNETNQRQFIMEITLERSEKDLLEFKIAQIFIDDEIEFNKGYQQQDGLEGVIMDILVITITEKIVK